MQAAAAIQGEAAMTAGTAIPDPAGRQSGWNLPLETAARDTRPGTTEPEGQSDRSRNTLNRRKTRILIDAAKHFCELPRPRYGDIEQFKELFYQLIGAIPPAERRIISAMLARSTGTPRQVALYLALDRIEIAAPFLMFSPVLSKLDLEKIVEKRGNEYAQVISRRNRDTKAFFEQPEFSELAKRDKAPDPLLEIRRAPEETTTNLSIPLVVQPEPDRIETGENPQQARKQSAKDEMLALAGRGGRIGRDRKAEPAIATDATDVTSEQEAEPVLKPVIGSLDAETTAKLHQLALKLDISGFAEVVNDLGGLAPEVTRRIVTARKGDEILYLIRALAVSFPTNRQIAMLLAPRYGRSIENYRTMSSMLEELDPGICRMIFNEIGASFEIPGAETIGSPVPLEDETLEAAASTEAEEDRSELPDFREAAHQRRQRLNKLIGTEKQTQFGHRHKEVHAPLTAFGS